MTDLYLIETNSSIEFIKTVLNSDTGVATQAVYFVIDTVSRLLIVISLGKKGWATIKNEQARITLLRKIIMPVYWIIGFIVPIGIILYSDSMFFRGLAIFNLSWFAFLWFIIIKMKAITDEVNSATPKE